LIFLCLLSFYQDKKSKNKNLDFIGFGSLNHCSPD